MRACIVRKLLVYLQKRHPDWVIRLELQLLENLTAKGFSVKSRSIWRLPAKKALKAYGEFTVECMKKHKADKAKLYTAAFAMGKRLRYLTGFTKEEDLGQLIFYLYENIGITMKGQLPGSIRVEKCYFSRWYTKEQCAWMSLVDAGIMAGMYGGGTLRFEERITTGCKACRACFRRKEVV